MITNSLELTKYASLEILKFIDNNLKTFESGSGRGALDDAFNAKYNNICDPNVPQNMTEDYKGLLCKNWDTAKGIGERYDSFTYSQKLGQGCDDAFSSMKRVYHDNDDFERDVVNSIQRQWTLDHYSDVEKKNLAERICVPVYIPDPLATYDNMGNKIR